MKTIKIDSNHITASDNQLTIPISGLVKQCKIINATISSNLTFTNSSVYSFAVNFSALDSKDVLVESWENVDFLKDVSSGEFAINISDELQTALDHNCSRIVLSFDCTDSIEFSESDLQIDYTSLSEYKENASSHNLDLGTSGKASVDLATGRLSMTAPITSNDNNVLPLSISANYHSIKNDKLPKDTGMPENWHLNVNQFLIKEENDDGDLQFTYIDVNGKNQTITEQYYYLDEGEPKDISRTELEVDLDGNYIYQGNPVKTKLVASSGLKLVSSISDIPGSELVDYEPEELIQVKDQVSQYENVIKELNTNISLQKKQFCVYALSKQMLEKQFELQESSLSFNERQINLQKKIEIIRKLSAEKNRYFRIGTNDANDGVKFKSDGSLDTATKSDYNLDNNTAINFFNNDSITEEKLNEFYSLLLDESDSEKLKENISLTDDQIIEGTIIANESSFIYSLGFNNDFSDGSIANQQDVLSKNQEMYIDSIEQRDFLNILQNTWKSFSEETFNLDYESLWAEFHYFINGTTKLTLSYKDLISTDIQLTSIITSLIKNEKQLSEYKELLKKAQHQQKLYEAQVPVHYLFNDSNVIYGFGKTLDENDNETNVYRLNLITDSYENAITITYESLTSNKITSITDSSDKAISFEYDETTGYLNNIIDARERKVSFNYENSLLKEINNNGKSTFFTYIVKESKDSSSTGETNVEPEFNLIGILSPAGTGAKFTYANDQVTEIQAISIMNSIEHGHSQPKANYNAELNNFLECLISDSKINFVYNNYKSTTVTNSKNKSITYVFDKYGKVRSTYETGYVDITNQTTPEDFYTKVNYFSYENDKIVYKTTKLPNSINYLSNIHCPFTAVEKKEALSLGSLTCGLDCIPYSYPVYADYYGMPHQGTTQYKVSIDGDNNNTILTKLNEDTANLLENINSNELNIGCNHRTLMLSTWAKADSAYIVTEDDETVSYPTYITDRKFELRALIYYKSETEPVTQSAQFDWRNTGWQYIALPLSLQLKDITKIEFILDYSNNTNTIDFTDFELNLGDFEKTEYNADGLPETKENGHSKWITSYQYDENSKVIKQTLINKFNKTDKFDSYFEYNKQGKLIKTTNFNNIIEETVYNDKGSVVKTLTYHKDEPANIICEETILDDKGKQPYAVNEFGEKLYDYEYIEGTGITSSTIDTKGVKTSYGYDNHDTLLQTTTSIKGEENTNIYGYTLDMLTALTHNNFDVKYAYDNKGRKTKISIADKTYLEKVYGENEEITFYKLSENENLYDVYKHTYDYNGNLLDVYYKHNITVEDKSQISFEGDTPILQNVYNIYGNLVYTKDFTNGEVSHTYSFDDFGQVEKQTTSLADASVVVTNKYKADHSTLQSCTIAISSENNKYGTQEMSYEYTYSEDPESKLQSIKSALGDENISYDKLGRVHKIDLAPLTKEFAYLKKGNYTSNLVSKINFATNNVINDNLTYKYDEKGNITEVRQYNKLVARYKYDSLSRIIREDNKDFNTTTTFEYDGGGNILCKKVYNFTIIDNLDFEKEIENHPLAGSYTYPISGWRDQLLSYNGQEIKDYDSLGNPWFYRGNQLQWSHGRQLDSFADVATYTYNANGIRTSKFANGFTTSYLLNGNKIIKQHDTLNLFDFYYGATGIEGFHLLSKNISGTILVDGSYYYKKNAQNDIIGIVDANGILIATYTYDAWGNHICKYLSNNGEYVAIENDYMYNDTSIINRFIAYKNPFRYRSYYYDFETGLYYLNSRYYDPELGRFINSDDLNYLDPETLNGLNLFAYCINNPINRIDLTGNWSWKEFWGWLTAGALAIASAIAIAVVALGVVASGGLLGAVLLGAGIGTLSAMTGSIVAQGGFSTANPWQIVQSGAIGAAIGAISGIFSWGFGTIGQSIGQHLGYSIGNTIHLSSGLKVGQIIGTTFLMNAGEIIGGVIGGLIGGTISNYMANMLFGNEMDYDEMMKEGMVGEIPSWVINIFRWLIS